MTRVAASTMTKRADDHIPYCRDQGMPYLAGAGLAGMAVQAKQITQDGAAPLVVTFADEGLMDMADDTYVVIVQGETASRVTVDQDTIATTGFNVLAGADTEVVHVLVIGRLAGQRA